MNQENLVHESLSQQVFEEPIDNSEMKIRKTIFFENVTWPDELKDAEWVIQRVEFNVLFCKPHEFVDGRTGIPEVTVHNTREGVAGGSAPYISMSSGRLMDEVDSKAFQAILEYAEEDRAHMEAMA